jgi:hypothetical protein
MSGIFNRTIEKLNKKEKLNLDTVINKIIDNTKIGEAKAGDIADIQVYSYETDKQLMLIAYNYQDERDKLLLIALGKFENYYRNLRR